MTSASATPISTRERVVLLDVLRGFALFGILVVNMGAFKANLFGPPRDPDLLDQAATWLIAFGFQTKFYVLFSFLFGYGLSVQIARATNRGAPLVPRYLRRLLGLLVLGLAHAALLYVGDILVTYALLGVALLLLRHARSSVLLGLAAVLVFGSALTFAALGSLASGAAPSDPTTRAEWGREAERSAAAYRGTPREVIEERVRDYPVTLAFALLGQGPTALSMFLVGLWAGRRRLVERIDEHAVLLRRVLAVGLVVGVPGAVAWATFRVVNGFTLDAAFLYAAAVDFATAPFLTAVYAISIAMLYQDDRWRRHLAVLAPVGRLALSNYLLQSLIGAFLFTGYGLALYGRLDAGLGLALSLTIFAVQVPLSGWWLRHFDLGPAEWLLRSFTYGRRQPFRSTRNRSRPATL